MITVSFSKIGLSAVPLTTETLKELHSAGEVRHAAEEH